MEDALATVVGRTLPVGTARPTHNSPSRRSDRWLNRLGSAVSWLGTGAVRDGHEDWEENMAEVLLTKSDNGRTIDAAVGDSLLVKLPENPTTGFRWTQEPGSVPAVRLRHRSFDRDTSGAVGALGTRTFQYEIVRSGEGLLQLRYWQEWEGENSIAETFFVTVVARD